MTNTYNAGIAGIVLSSLLLAVSGLGLLFFITRGKWNVSYLIFLTAAASALGYVAIVTEIGVPPPPMPKTTPNTFILFSMALSAGFLTPLLALVLKINAPLTFGLTVAQVLSFAGYTLTTNLELLNARYVAVAAGGVMGVFVIPLFLSWRVFRGFITNTIICAAFWLYNVGVLIMVVLGPDVAKQVSRDVTDTTLQSIHMAAIVLLGLVAIMVYEASQTTTIRAVKTQTPNADQLKKSAMGQTDWADWAEFAFQTNRLGLY